jgi:hypothetical protein
MTVDSDASDTPRGANEVEALLLFEEARPVCGWLACIAGPHQGMSYTLHSGKNFIGRADDMDVRIPGDSFAARRNHAIVAYDPMNREFTLLPGESDGLVYLNGEVVYGAARLTDMGLIRLGHTSLLFRPLCGDNFSWETDGE